MVESEVRKRDCPSASDAGAVLLPHDTTAFAQYWYANDQSPKNAGGLWAPAMLSTERDKTPTVTGTRA